MRTPRAIVMCLSAACALLCACSDGAATCANPGGAVSGMQDNHCTLSRPTSAASCHPADGGMADGGTDQADGGGGMSGGDYGPTLFNSEGDDDDCKYHVKWSAAPVCQNGDVTFTLIVTKKTDGSPLSGAAPRTEVFLNETHPAPNTDEKATEQSPGSYKVGPVRFDAAGKWTVRFHLFEDCSDTAQDSPHGHAAFFVNVP